MGGKRKIMKLNNGRQETSEGKKENTNKASKQTYTHKHKGKKERS